MVVTGFQNEITGKVTGFGGHIVIGNFTSNQSYESEPFDASQLDLKKIESLPHVEHVQQFAVKATVIKTSDEIQGAVLKGIGKDYNWDYLKKHLTAGSILHWSDSAKSDDVIISEKIANMLHLKLKDKVYFYFIEGGNQLIRKLTIQGIYNTGFDEVDNTYIFCDIRQIQRLNNWKINEIGGYEVLIDDFKNLDKTTASVYNATGFQYNSKSIKEFYPQIFGWLGLINANVYIIIGLMLLVACINMTSTLLIIILENTSDIGILKALGARDVSIRKIFFYVSLYLVAGGIFLGNVLGLGLAMLQHYFHIVTLPEETYYIAYAPVSFSFFGIAILNLITLVVCVVVLLVPALIVSRIQPIKAIRFE